MRIVVKKLIEGCVTRLVDTVQYVSAHVDVEVLSWPGGSLIAVLLWLYAIGLGSIARAATLR